jgi:hypothetical protein
LQTLLGKNVSVLLTIPCEGQPCRRTDQRLISGFEKQTHETRKTGV